MLKAILAEPTAPRWRVVAQRRWGLGSRVRGDNEMRRLHTISATIGPRPSHPLRTDLPIERFQTSPSGSPIDD